jgi:uncharacterized membrane protein
MIEDVRRQVARAGYLAVVLGLSGGTVLYLLDQGAMSRGVLGATLVVLVALPILNVLAVLAEEIERRDWIFAGLALAVLALLWVAMLK